MRNEHHFDDFLKQCGESKHEGVDLGCIKCCVKGSVMPIVPPAHQKTLSNVPGLY